MHLKSLVTIAAITLVAATGGVAPVAAQTPEALPAASPVASGAEFVGVGLQQPESVLYDPVDDVYLVSSLNGNPGEVDDNGFITRLSPAGEVLSERWIDGDAEDVELSAPKGSAIVGDTFSVTDITAVRQFDRATGEPIGAIEIPGATFLNDIAAGPDGSLFVSDMGLAPNEAGELVPSGTDAIYRIAPDGTVAPLAQGPDVAAPNGLAVRANGDVVVAPFLETGEIYELNAQGERRDIAQVPGGLLDGLVVLPDESLLASSWAIPGVVRITPDGEVVTVIDGISSPADIGFDSTRNLVLIPDMTENRLLIAPVLD